MSTKTLCDPAQYDADCVFDVDGPCALHVTYSVADLKRNPARRVDRPLYYALTIDETGRADGRRKPGTGKFRVGETVRVTREDLEYTAVYLASQTVNSITMGSAIIFPDTADSWAFYRATAVEDTRAFLTADQFQELAYAVADWDEVIRGNQLQFTDSGELIVDEEGVSIES